jgi:hypothetical protein
MLAMYEGLGIRFTKERKKLTPKAIVSIVITGVLVVSFIGYAVFWNIKISAPFRKFYGEDTVTDFTTAGKTPTGYSVMVTKPFFLEFGVSIGYVSIKTIDEKYMVWFYLDALTDEIVDWIISVEIEPIEYNGIIRERSVGFQLDKDWRVCYTNPENPSLTNGKTSEGKTAQEYADENRAELQKMFDEIERRWGYEFPP